MRRDEEMKGQVEGAVLAPSPSSSQRLHLLAYL
jgi:hypothetical protein